MSVFLLPRLTPAPAFAREGISWRSVAPGRVEISVEVSNVASEPTEAGELVIEAAALGAFVPFRPVARIALGALEPGERRRLARTVDRGLLNRVAALPRVRMGDLVRQAFGVTDVDPRVLEWVSQSEWIGNVNVWFDRRPERAVERHCAFGLRISAGRPVAAMVDLPTSRKDYRIDASCIDPRWAIDLASLVDRISVLLVRPPGEPGIRAGVTVLVTRVSDGREVPVEFEFETA